MRTALKFTILMILSVTVLAASVSAQDKTDPGSAKPGKNDASTQKPEGKSSESPEKPKQTNDAEEGIEFPAIDDWDRSAVQNYPDPALGSSVTYQSAEGGRVTIYVYNGGQKTIPNGIGDKTVKEEIERAKNEIEQIGKMGVYKDVKEIKNDTVRLGGTGGKVKALRSVYSFKVQGAAVDSEIYLFGYNNNFIKIRATRPASADGAENKVLMSLLAEIDKIFAR